MRAQEREAGDRFGEGKNCRFYRKRKEKKDSRERKRKRIDIVGENSEFSPISRLRDFSSKRSSVTKYRAMQSTRNRRRRVKRKGKNGKERCWFVARFKVATVSPSTVSALEISPFDESAVDRVRCFFTFSRRIFDFLYTYDDNKEAEKCAPARTIEVEILQNRRPLCQPCPTDTSAR